MKEKSTKVLKIVGIAAGAAALAVAGAAVGANMFPKEVVVEKQVPVEVIKEVPVEVPVETVKEVPVKVEVPVDNGNLQTVLDYIYDNDGEVYKVIEDLDDNEVNQIVDRIIYENGIIVSAEELVKASGIEYLDDEMDIFDDGDLEDYRDNDVYSFRIEEDDTNVSYVDYDDKEATVYVIAKMKLDNDDDKTYKYVKFEVEVDGKDIEIVDAEILA